MKRTMYFMVIALAVMIVPCQDALAAEATFQGSLTVHGQLLSVNGDMAKFNEYSDTRDGIYSSINLNYDSNTYFMRFNAEDILYRTERYSLDGGMWGKFRYYLLYHEMPHNTTFGARTFYSGAGSSSLDLMGDPDDVTTWATFDYKTERRRIGAGISLVSLEPFYFNFSGQTEKKTGIKPSAYGDLSGSGVVFELPALIDYRTDTFHVEGGYSRKPFHASLSYEQSRFNNNNQALDFYDLSLGGPNSVALAPDNDYYKVAFRGAVFLPYNSRLSLNAGTSRTKSHAESNNLLGFDDFYGRVVTKNLDIVLTTNPVSSVNGKIFFKYYDRDDKSETGEDHMGYITNKFGGQLGLRLPAHFRLTVGYMANQTRFDGRYDARKRKDDIYSADLTWSGLDFAAFRIGYERRHRDTDRSGTAAVADFDTLWRFDVAPSDRDMVKVSVDLSPANNLSVTLGYKYMESNYEDKALSFASRGLGLRDYKSDGFFVDAGYNISGAARVYGYFDYEKVRSLQYGYSSSDPTDWSLARKESNYDYGIGADFIIIPKKVTVRAAYDYVRSDGAADFSYLDIMTPAGLDILNWGDYRKRVFTVSAKYEMTRSMSLTAGYRHEEFRLEDILLSGYEYRPADDAYLTGAYKGQSYRANVLFMNAVYRF